MGSDGSVRTLPPNMEVDRGSGNIRQRSPDEQAAYERKWREDRRAAAESIHPLDRAAAELREGRITQKEFDDRVAQYNEDHGRTPKSQETPAPDAGETPEAEPTEPAEPAGPRDILSLVKPVEVTAVGVSQVDASYQEFKNIVTVTVTLRFWNVGALAPGYGSVSMTARAVASLNGVEQTTTCSGSFSGGPSGTLRVSCGDDHMQGVHGGQLQNGQRIDLGQGIVATVKNPQAFANWPKGY
jgi:hypothetical protein